MDKRREPKNYQYILLNIVYVKDEIFTIGKD